MASRILALVEHPAADQDEPPAAKAPAAKPPSAKPPSARPPATEPQE
jgi:hypothetical protein